MRLLRPRPINYAIYALLISISCGGIVFSTAGNPMPWALPICFAPLVLRWQQYRQPIKFRAPRLGDLIAAAPTLLSVAALLLFTNSIHRAGVLDEHLWNNKPLIACLWGAFLLAPLREMLSKSDKTDSETTERVAPHEPPPRAGVSDAPDDRTLDSLPGSDPSGGR